MKQYMQNSLIKSMKVLYIQTMLLMAIGGFFCLDAQAQLSVASGETVKVTSADELVLLDDLVNNGTIERITLGGTSAQTITGTGTIYHLKLSKSALGNTATISSGMQSVTGTVDLTAGTLAAGGFLTLKSDANGTVRVLEHTTAGSLDGNVTVERYINVDGRAKQWRTLGFPHSGNLTLSTLGGFSIDYTTGTRSVMYYNEGNDNGLYGSNASQGRNTGYVSFTSSSESIPAGQGVMAWLYGNSGGTANSSGNMTGALTITSTGPLNESGDAVSLPVYYTTARTNKGWNLVSNPFASSIDWSHDLITKTRINASIYRWNPISASWTTHNGSTGTPSDLTGLDGIIEAGGAFFVQAEDASPILTIPQSAKTGTPTTFVHFGRAPGRLQLPGERARTENVIRLSGVRASVKGQGNPMPDEVYVDLSRADATSGFDSRYDAETIGRTSGAGISVRDLKDRGYTMQFDAPISESGVERRYYPLRVTSPAKGATTLELWTEGAWNPLNSVSLIDRKEGRTVLLKGGRLTYPFTMDELQSGDRFQLAVNHVKVEKDGLSPVFDVRLLGNPVTGDRIDLLVSHPTAKAEKWSLLMSSGQQAGTGAFTRDGETLQHRITVPGMRQPGIYLLRVLMENGDEKVVKVVRQ
jgi:hypothetical protein